MITFVDRVLGCPVDIPQRRKVNFSFVVKKFVDSLIAMSEGDEKEVKTGRCGKMVTKLVTVAPPLGGTILDNQTI